MVSCFQVNSAERFLNTVVVKGVDMVRSLSEKCI